MIGTLGVVGAYPRLSEAENELKAGRIEEATKLVMKHLRDHRNEPRGMAMLGTLAMRGGALVQAEQFLRHAMALGARSFEVESDLAGVINQQERLGEALNAFAYLATQSTDPQIRATKAHILDKLGRNSEAIRAYEALIAEDPETPRFWIGYGLSLRSAGRTDDAVAAYRRATQIDVENGEAWWALANIKAKVLTDDD